MTRPLHGMVLGKFLPPHRGHELLVDFARRACTRLTIVVGSLAREPIPGTVRVEWMRRLFPQCRVVHLDEELPQLPEEDPLFWERWQSALTRVLPAPVDLVFASEAYGAPLAARLGARWMPLARDLVPVSGTAIRNDPMGHWDWIPEVVRPWFLRRVCIFGPESTGKTTLARKLAARFDTLWVPEYARLYLEQRGGAVEVEDMTQIMRGQLALREALEPRARGIVFCDTDCATTGLWSDVLFGHKLEVPIESFDLTLLCDIDLPWEADPVRYLPEDRRGFLDRCVQVLGGRRMAWVRGSGSARVDSAIRALHDQLGLTPAR